MAERWYLPAPLSASCQHQYAWHDMACAARGAACKEHTGLEARETWRVGRSSNAVPCCAPQTMCTKHPVVCACHAHAKVLPTAGFDAQL